MTGGVLDAGCGPGHWTHYLTQLGLDARGIDLVPSFIDHARSSYPGIPFDLQSIDAIDDPRGRGEDGFGTVLARRRARLPSPRPRAVEWLKATIRSATSDMTGAL